MRNPGIGFVLAGVGVLLFFVMDVVFTSGMRERERHEFHNRELLDGAPRGDEDLDQVDPYAEFRRDILGGDDDFLTRDEMRDVYDGRDLDYTIKKGDSLRKIAKKYLGDEKLVSVLKEYNPVLLEGVPPSGTKIVIPLRHRR